MQFRLRTALILLAVMPPMLAGAWWEFREWQFRRELKSMPISFESAVTIDDQYRNVEKARAEARARIIKSSK